MPAFWRNNRPRPDDPAYQQARAAHPSSGARLPRDVVNPPAAFPEPLLSEDDWALINELLAAALRPQEHMPTDRIAELLGALDRLQGSADGPFVDVVEIMGELLNVWSIAIDISRPLAVPLEKLLIGVLGRELATAYEVNTVCNEVRIAALRLIATGSA